MFIYRIELLFPIKHFYLFFSYKYEGKIIEEGTHDELILLGGKYAKMVGLQYVQLKEMPTDKCHERVVEDEVSYD